MVEVERWADGRRLALKYCRAAGAALKRFAREVRLMARVRHRNVVPVLDFALDVEVPYFVMPLAVGSLEDDLPRLSGRLVEALGIFRQACLGIQAIHASGIVHRDIKPANILRFANGRMAVSDLGVATLAARDSSVLTQTRAVVGTLGFLAPEQLLPDGSRKADARTDVYQLGKVLYQLATGRSPLLIEPEALPGGLSHVVRRATSPSPADRYRDVAEMLDALRYFELSLDPARNAREAFENLVLEAEALLHQREYRAENVQALLGALAAQDDPEPSTLIDRFDRLPDALLPVLAADFPREFLPVLRALADALPLCVGSFRFAYADMIARRMRSVFLATSDPSLKALALRVMLTAAVLLNRFSAMDAFNRLLMSVSRIEHALPVAEMLRAQSPYFAEAARGACPDRLHPAIREIQLSLLTACSETSF